MRFPVRAALAVLVLLSACAGVQTTNGGEPDYAPDAAANLREGNKALARKDYLTAGKYFEHVRTKFPFLEAATESELRLADLDFQQDAFSEARDRYQNFVKLHPSHPKLDYAAFRAALTHVREMPEGPFFLPPSEEKDQAEVRAAQQALNDFLRQYPQSSYRKESEVLLRDVQRRLADHEIYAARFYARREKWPAVVQRLETLLERYPGTPVEEEALFSLHDAYVRLKKPAQAQGTLRRVVDRLPGTPAAARAQRMLGS